MEVRQFHDKSPQEKLSVTNKKKYIQDRCTVPQNKKKVPKSKKFTYIHICEKKYSFEFYTSNLTQKTNICIDFYAYYA